MSFRSLCVALIGGFIFAALYHVILWVKDRRGALSLIAAAHAATAAGYAWSLFHLIDAGTVAAMQQAVTFRALAAAPVVITVVALSAALANLPVARPLMVAIGAVGATALGRILSGNGGSDVTAVVQVTVWGEPLWAPLRTTGPSHWFASVVIVGASVYALWCGWRLRRIDRPSGALLIGTALVGLLVAPFVTVLQPWALPWQPLTLIPQAMFDLVAVMLLAERHRARGRRARDAERLFRAMFDQTYQLVALLDLEGRVLAANRRALELGGITEAECVGRPLDAVPAWAVSPDRERLSEAIDAAARGITSRFETVHVTGAGVVYPADVSLRPLRDAEGAITRVIAEARDISEERLAVDAQRNVEAQLAQSQKLEAVGQLAGGIAHDFNNLLTVIQGFSALLAASPEMKARRGELDQIQTASERAMALTRQLLSFSSHAVADVTSVALPPLLRRVEPLLQRQVGADVTLRLHLDEATPPITADAGQLERILVNLAANARDAMPSGGLLEIEARPLDAARDRVSLTGPGPWAVLSVRDTGAGMTPDVRARLFEPFFTTKGHGQGTGLGLAVLDRVVKQARGVVDVETEVGRGTTFRLYFPARLDPRPAAPAVVVDVRGTERVLVVDDEPALRELAAASLASCGFAVLKAGSPADAIAVIDAQAARIDALVSDVVMPGGSATAIAAHLHTRWPEAAVLYMSGYPADEAVRQGVVTGAADFLQKPFTPDVLTTRVRQMLDRR